MSLKIRIIRKIWNNFSHAKTENTVDLVWVVKTRNKLYFCRPFSPIYQEGKGKQKRR